MRGGQGGGVRQHVSPRTVIKILQIAAIWAAAAGSTAYVDAMIGGDARPPMCVVIRTFWGHGEAGNGGEGSLRKLLTTLREQTNPNWEAVIVVMDSKPFRDLHHIIQSYEDERIWVYAEWVGQEHTPKINGIWTARYHEKLYNLTDDAIRACPSNTEWVVVTNGDNNYALSFFDEIAATSDHDLIAFDFYTRYHRASGLPCQRFEHQEGCPDCKRNKLRWCQTDLGANVMRWPRLVKENKRFGDLISIQGSGAAEHFDGYMAQVLSWEWPTKRVQRCLYTHSPSPQWCARSGHVWDDSDVSPTAIGGSCVDLEEAKRRLLKGNVTLEEVAIRIARDDHLTEFLEHGTTPLNDLRCLRRKDALQQRFEQMMYFGEVCSEDCDMGMFNDSDFKVAKDRAHQAIIATDATNNVQSNQTTGHTLSKPPPPPKRRSQGTQKPARYRELFSDSCSVGGGGSCNFRL